MPGIIEQRGGNLPVILDQGVNDQPPAPVEQDESIRRGRFVVRDLQPPSENDVPDPSSVKGAVVFEGAVGR